MKEYTIFDRIINELMIEDTGTEHIDKCLKSNYNLSRKVPLRYKIISMGFVHGFTLQELNRELQEHGLGSLYARNLWEASLIFAFNNRLSYEEWREIADSIHDIKSRLGENTDVLAQSKISMKTLRKYIGENSYADSKTDLLTMHKTREMEESIRKISNSQEFLKHLLSNIVEFRNMRDKTRYYFCKYLWFYLERKIEAYMRIASRGIHYRSEDIMEELSIFKGASKVKRSSMSNSEIRAFLEDASISCGVIFAEFNEFFFGYVSLDWMQVLLEQAGDLKNLPENSIHKLAASARSYDKKYAKMDDFSIIRALDEQIQQQEEELDQEASLDSLNRGYQKNRGGEHTVRKYLKGVLDLDRTTFICFLLFFGSDLTKPTRLFLDQTRLNTILKECGFQKLNPYNDFDFFVINFLDAEDPVDYLMEEVTRYALSKENFYLYKLYQVSRSDDADILKILTS